jgi:crotonobetainyl-CoA:carnitine CoA-transferase CaiB-like acyl-CoA transferase
MQGMGGLMSVTGPSRAEIADDASGGGPQKVGVAVADLFTGMYAVTAILAALRHRDATGQGQAIDMALLDTQVAMLANLGANYLVTGVAPQRAGNAHQNIVPYQVFEVADGHMILASATTPSSRASARSPGCPGWRRTRASPATATGCASAGPGAAARDDARAPAASRVARGARGAKVPCGRSTTSPSVLRSAGAATRMTVDVAASARRVGAASSRAR